MGQVRTVNVVGLGYVGTASCLHIASQGARVHGWDTSRERVAGLRSGALPFHEPDLLEQHSRLAPGAMSFVEEAANLPRADLWVICVGTPADPRTGLLDTRDVVQALRTVLENCMAREDFHPLLLLRSTVPPLTYRNELRPLVEEFSSTHARFKPRFFYFPEFMREGSALADCRDPALAVLGSDTGFEGVETIRAVFGLESREIDQTSVAVAEMIKISSNAFHTLKVTFANEIASLSHSLGCDGEEVMRLFVKDRKLNISPSYLRPGFAYGGPCLAKDLSHLHRAAGVQGLELPVLGAIQGSNQKHLMRARDLIEKVASGVSDIGVIGTAFKDGCTDRRSSPVIQLLEELAKRQPRRRFHFLAEPVTDAPPLAGAMVHAEASSLLRDVGVLVLGSHPKIAALIPGIESFTGPVVDLMMMPRATYSLRRRSGYHRLC